MVYSIMYYAFAIAVEFGNSVKCVAEIVGHIPDYDAPGALSRLHYLYQSMLFASCWSAKKLYNTSCQQY